MGIYGEIEIETMQLGHDQWHATRAEYLKRMTPAAGGRAQGPSWSMPMGFGHRHFL
jgi:hypothetical protein